jgi:N-acyl-L-homoserine lactone synthetase
VHAQLIAQLGETVRGLGASHCLTLLAATWPRWADRVGVKMQGMGPVMEIDGIENQVVLMDFSQTVH